MYTSHFNRPEVGGLAVNLSLCRNISLQNELCHPSCKPRRIQGVARVCRGAMQSIKPLWLLHLWMNQFHCACAAGQSKIQAENELNEWLLLHHCQVFLDFWQLWQSTLALVWYLVMPELMGSRIRQNSGNPKLLRAPLQINSSLTEHWRKTRRHYRPGTVR